MKRLVSDYFIRRLVMSSKEKKELIDILDRALSNGELAVFAGAGLSLDAGYCNWKELLQEAAKKLRLDINKEEYDLISLAQFYCNEYNRSGINELVSNSFATNRRPTENHKIPSLSLEKKNNRQKLSNTKRKSLLFFIFVLL